MLSDGVLKLKDGKTRAIVVEFDLIETARGLSERYASDQQASERTAIGDSALLLNTWQVAPGDMVFEKNQGKIKTRMLLDGVYFQRTNGTDSIEGAKGMLLITRP